MRQSSLVWCVLCAVLVIGVQPAVSFSQQATPAAPAAAATATPTTASTKRLPAYYKDVVTEVQRQDIYKIQAKYSDQLSALTEQIKKIQAARNAEIEAVLNAEQKAKIEAAKLASAKKRAAATAALKPSALPAAVTAPAAVPAAVATPVVPATPAVARPATK